MKKINKKEEKENLIGALVFYAVIIIGVLVLNARCAYLNEQKSVEATQTTTQINR
jgi:hypothetical protein